MKLIVGFGNPGEEYFNNRQNIGFKVVDILGNNENIDIRVKKKKSIKNDKLRWDLFINPNAEYIEFNTKFGILKISPIDEILEWKFRFLEKHTLNTKHKQDLNL